MTNFRLHALTIALVSVTLTGCAASNANTNPQSVSNTSTQAAPAVYVQASNAATAAQNTQTQYVAVPVPGQLMPVPSATTTASAPKFTSPTQAVDYANQNATVQPTTGGNFFNAMMTYNYMDGVLYTIYTAPMHITDISLAPGEKLISEAAGDTLRWQVAQTYSGQGANLTQHVLVKPSQSGLTNTMVITTDQRVYHLILQSTDNSYMASVQWNYDNNMVNYGNDANSNPDLATPPDTSPSVDLSNLDFNYQYSLISGSQPAWYPVRVFNDGQQTYIQLAPNYSATQLPVLFVADDSGNYGTSVNWRYRAPYIIVDTVLQNARLQTGVQSTGETIVQITHTGQ